MGCIVLDQRRRSWSFTVCNSIRLLRYGGGFLMVLADRKMSTFLPCLFIYIVTRRSIHGFSLRPCVTMTSQWILSRAHYPYSSTECISCMDRARVERVPLPRLPWFTCSIDFVGLLNPNHYRNRPTSEFEYPPGPEPEAEANAER